MQVLGVHTPRECRLREGGRKCRRCAFSDRFQEPLSVTERADAKFLQVDVGELSEKSEIDVVLGKTLRVLLEAQSLQPLPEVHSEPFCP